MARYLADEATKRVEISTKENDEEDDEKEEVVEKKTSETTVVKRQVVEVTRRRSELTRTKNDKLDITATTRGTPQALGQVLPGDTGDLRDMYENTVRPRWIAYQATNAYRCNQFGARVRDN
jgi:hypothetical protein